MSAIRDLITRWVTEAETLERCGHESTGKLICRLSVEVEEALRYDQDETLTLAEAALESSYSSEHLRKQVSAGAIPNAGRKGRPRIRRSDLPRKPSNGQGQIGSPENDARNFLQTRSGS